MMLFIPLLLIQLCELAGADTEEAAILCTSDACFTLHMDKVSFDNASMKCKENGGYLVTAEDNTKEAEIQSVLSRIDEMYRDSDLKFWIGLKLRRGECVIDGLALMGFNWIPETTKHGPYSNWESEPRRTCTEERCVTIQYDLSTHSGLTWTDGPCKDTAFYVCKFKFRGMCKPLLLTGLGKLHYTVPFSVHPLTEDNDLSTFPFGTLAEVSCNDNSYHNYICRAVEGLFRWTMPGRTSFCASDMHSCGGCDHVCSDSEAGGVGCACQDGIELGKDKVSCGAKDYCHSSPCQYQCVTNGAGFSCACPEGLQLDTDQFKCVDIDECQMQACGDDHICINMQGSYTCTCMEGYEMVGGKCRDIDECSASRCEQRCLNSQGSFSCHCIAGFTAHEDGRSCTDMDECLSNRCEFKCTNTIGSFKCSCQTNFRLHPNGMTCIRDLTVDSTPATSRDIKITFTHGDALESLTMPTSLTVPTAELEKQPRDTDEPPPNTASMNGITLDQPTRKGPFGATAQGGNDTFNSRMLVCVVGSVVPLVLLIAVTFCIVIFRCGRSKRELKKNATADSYCWVSSGLDIKLEKVDASKLTDDH